MKSMYPPLIRFALQRTRRELVRGASGCGHDTGRVPCPHFTLFSMFAFCFPNLFSMFVIREHYGLVRSEVAGFSRISEHHLNLFSLLLATWTPLPFHPQVFVYRHHHTAASQSEGNGIAKVKSRAKFHLAAPHCWLWRDREVSVIPPGL